MSRLLLSLACSAMLTAGCGSGTTVPTSTAVTPVSTPLKTVVEGFANTGEIGSAGQELADKYEELKKTDAAKAESIKADIDALLKADGKPAQVRKLAVELAKKL